MLHTCLFVCLFATEVKAALGHGNQRACSSDEKTAMLRDTVDNLGVRKRDRIQGKELLSDEEVLSLPQTLRGIEGVIDGQLEWRGRPDYAVHLSALHEKRQKEAEETEQLLQTSTWRRRFASTREEAREEAAPSCPGGGSVCRICDTRYAGDDAEDIYECHDCGQRVCNGCSHVFVTKYDEHQYRCIDNCGGGNII